MKDPIAAHMGARMKRKRVMCDSCRKFLCTLAILLCISFIPAVPGGAQQDSLSGYGCIFSGVAPNSSATATFWNNKSGELHYKLEVKKIDDIIMAHLHLGTVKDFGTPVVWLYPASPPPKLVQGEFSGVLAEGVISEEDFIGPLRGRPMSELVNLLENGQVYANIHTQEHRKGEICGQVRLIEPGKGRKRPEGN
jgi:hypothetical protein